MYIATGEVQKTLRDKLLMSTKSPYNFDHLVQVSNKSLWILILYTFLMGFFFHTYIARGRGRQPFVDKILMSTEKPCQGQPRVIIWTNYDGPKAPMLHTNSQGHWPFGSGKDFWRFLPYMSVAAILVMWPRPHEQTFVPPLHWSSIWNLALIDPAVLEKIFENGGRRTDGRTTDHGYTISSPIA